MIGKLYSFSGPHTLVLHNLNSVLWGKSSSSIKEISWHQNPLYCVVQCVLSIRILVFICICRKDLEHEICGLVEQRVFFCHCHFVNVNPFWGSTMQNCIALKNRQCHYSFHNILSILRHIFLPFYASPEGVKQNPQELHKPISPPYHTTMYYITHYITTITHHLQL